MVDYQSNLFDFILAVCRAAHVYLAAEFLLAQTAFADTAAACPVEIFAQNVEHRPHSKTLQRQEYLTSGTLLNASQNFTVSAQHTRINEITRGLHPRYDIR